MRILWLKSDLLLPLDKGGKLRTWHLMRHLARRHEITYLAFAEAGARAEDVAGMRSVASHVVTVPREDPAKRSLSFYIDAARYLADPLPYAVAKYRSRAYQSALAALLDERPFDVVVCDFLVPAINMPRHLPCPVVLFTHNVEAEIWRRHAARQTRAPVRWLYTVQHRRMARFERAVLRRFDRVLTVSEADRVTFDRLYPGAIRTPAGVVPTGVDTEYFSPGDEPPAPATLVFTGSMDWLPNEDAVSFFCQDVLPLVRKADPSVQLTVVGRDPTPVVKRLAARHGILVTGRVDDVRPFVRQAAAYVVPLRIGGGTRLKIFEAMAMGKAVVSTTIGAEGLPVVNGEHVVIADEPQAFAEAVIRVLRDHQYRFRLEAAARDLVTSRYNWSAAAQRLEEALIDAARRGAYTPSASPARAPAGTADYPRPLEAGRPGA